MDEINVFRNIQDNLNRKINICYSTLAQELNLHLNQLLQSMLQNAEILEKCVNEEFEEILIKNNVKNLKCLKEYKNINTNDSNRSSKYDSFNPTEYTVKKSNVNFENKNSYSPIDFDNVK